MQPPLIVEQPTLASSVKKKKEKKKQTIFHVRTLFSTSPLSVTVTSEKWDLTNYQGPINLIYGWSSRGAPLIHAFQDTVLWEGRGGGGGVPREGVMVRGRNWMRGTERNREKPPQQNFTNNQASGATLAGFFPFLPHGCLVPSNTTSAVTIKFWRRRLRGVRAWKGWTVY